MTGSYKTAANSGVGRAVIAFGKARGYRIIKSRPPDRAVAEVEAAGGEVVLVDDDAAPGRIAEIVSDGSIRLALDGVRCAATARLAKTLSQHGELVGYMVGYSAPGELRDLMDKDFTLHSFYQVRPDYDAKVPSVARDKCVQESEFSSFLKIESAEAVQVKGFGSLLCSAR